MAKHTSLLNDVDRGKSWVLAELCFKRITPKHAAPMAEWEKELLDLFPPHKYDDAWAGNPDTDKYWSK